jgi:hypothetical protein
MKIKQRSSAVQTLGRKRARSARSSSINHHLLIPGTVRIQCAEYWLGLGAPELALRELEPLPSTAWNEPAAVQARATAQAMLQDKTELAVEE